MNEPPDRKGLSLEHKLPLLISGLLLALVCAGSVLAYLEVREIALEVSGERLDRVAHQLADLMDAAVIGRLERVTAAADHPAIGAVASGAGGEQRDAARQALDELQEDQGNLMAELRDAEGDFVIAVGGFPPGWTAAQIDSARRVGGVPAGGGYSSLVTVDDDRYVWAIAPVERNGERLGEVAILRPVGAYASHREIRDLIGPGTQIYFVNEGGGSWITLAGELRPPMMEAPPRGGVVYRRPDGRPYLAYAAPVGSGGFDIVAEFPMAEVLAGAQSLVRRLAVGASLLLLLGVLGAWALSRKLTAPIRQLADASREVAAGDYSARVALEREDELGALGDAFNRMAGEVETSHVRLRRAYEEARRMADTIEESNRQLTLAIMAAEQARGEAETANRAKSEFVATLSHELRTPLQSVIAYAEILEFKIAGSLEPEQRKQVERIRASGRHLVALVDETLDLDRVESGRLQIESTPMLADEAFDDALAVVAPEAARRGIELRRSPEHVPDLRAMGDRKRVRQILINLLSNAIKFTPRGGSIEVRAAVGAGPGGPKTGGPASYAAESDGAGPDGDEPRARLIVRDTGIGIAPEQLDRIFEPFVQGAMDQHDRTPGSEAADPARRGVGLGLTICRKLAEAMGGSLTVVSEPERGSIFTLELPLVREPEPAGEGDEVVGAESPSERGAGRS